MKYLIKVQGILDESWSDWLGNVEITCQVENGALVTSIHGEGPDQSTLFGILERIRDLNLTLISAAQSEQST